MSIHWTVLVGRASATPGLVRGLRLASRPLEQAIFAFHLQERNPQGPRTHTTYE